VNLGTFPDGCSPAIEESYEECQMRRRPYVVLASVRSMIAAVGFVVAQPEGAGIGAFIKAETRLI
jgi:hypothetical protein